MCVTVRIIELHNNNIHHIVYYNNDQYSITVCIIYDVCILYHKIYIGHESVIKS
jgi:hypothetical protein